MPPPPRCRDRPIAPREIGVEEQTDNRRKSAAGQQPDNPKTHIAIHFYCCWRMHKNTQNVLYSDDSAVLDAEQFDTNDI